MPAKVYITGIGIISALGKGVEENWHALKAGTPGIALPQFLQSNLASSYVAGEVRHSNAELSDIAGASGNAISRTALLGLIALREALNNAGLSSKELTKAGLLNGTSVGGMDRSELFYKPFKEGAEFDYQKAFGGHDCGFSTEWMADTVGIKSFVSTISTACSSSANTIMQAGRLIKAGKAQCLVAGGTDALSVFTMNGFNALKILDQEWCKPFDMNRKGLNLGEGAAYLVLESEEHVQNRNGKVLAQLKGYGNANDAYHQTASSPEGKGAYLAMKKAFEVADDDKLYIDYINAHGTGTGNNDLSESTALGLMFGKNIPDYSSTKSYTGHTLGAAGGIEAVFSVLAINNNYKFPNLNLSDDMELLPKEPLKFAGIGQDVSNILSNSFGFGGNCTSLIFGKN